MPGGVPAVWKYAAHCMLVSGLDNQMDSPAAAGVSVHHKNQSLAEHMHY